MATGTAKSPWTDLHQLLRRLYQQQLARTPDSYLEQHSDSRWVQGHVQVFRWYVEYLPKQGTLLDVGCAHGPDSCLIRSVLGNEVDLHGCDFHERDRYDVFRGASSMNYQKLDDTLR